MGKRFEERERSEDSSEQIIHFPNGLVFLFVKQVKICCSLARHWAYLRFFTDTLLSC